MGQVRCHRATGQSGLQTARGDSSTLGQSGSSTPGQGGVGGTSFISPRLHFVPFPSFCGLG